MCLEYDESPCGGYKEVVDMGSLVTRNGAVGQCLERVQDVVDLCDLFHILYIIVLCHRISL